MSATDEYLSISALQHYAYCPRQFALIHIEGAWADNRLTAEGRLLHDRVDSGLPEKRRAVRYERAVSLVSHCLRLVGKTDLLEIRHDHGEDTYFPVEYKRGRPKGEQWDRVQLCAQALCIEEMVSRRTSTGALWYWQARKREQVEFDSVLRTATLETVKAAHALFSSGITPNPVNDNRCDACSLLELCQPKSFAKDRTASYIDRLFEPIQPDQLYRE